MSVPAHACPVMFLYPDVYLLIVGEGDARIALEALSADTDFGDRIIFLGQSDNPFPILKRATAFILASEHEGFSNSVMEAMFLDVPVVTSFCSSDAREMNAAGAALGFEVADTSTLQGHMRELLESTASSDRLRNCARIYRKPHELAQSISEYERLLTEVAYGGGR